MPELAADRSPPPRARPADDRLGCQLMIVGRRWRQLIDAELEAFGLSHATWRPLLKLVRAAEPLRQHELAGLLQIGHPELVRLLDSLERKRLVERRDAADDRRVKRIALTAAGRRLAARVEATIAAFDRRLLRGVSPEDRAHCHRVFAQIEERLDALEAAANPRKKSRDP